MARHQLLIDGQWIDASAGACFDVEDPATGMVIAQAAAGDSADVDAAVMAARRAIEGPWKKIGPVRRANLLGKLADRLSEMAEEFARIETSDVGQPLFMSRFGAQSIADVVRYNAGWCTRIAGEPVCPLSEGEWHAYTVREPVGVVGLIVPWNAPYTMTVSKVSALLAAGCTVVIKPAEQTPLSTLRLGDLFQELGFPNGVVNIVTGFGASAGAALVEHPGVEKIAFTGSTETGKAILRAAAGSLKRVSLELGGKSPIIILPDADIDAAISTAAAGIFLNSGQICVAGSRLYAHHSVFDRVLEGIVARAQSLRVGAGVEPDVEMGPLVSKAQLDRVAHYVEEGRKDGASVVVGGARIGDSGYFMQPTVITDVSPDMSIMREEIFGPVLAATSFDTASLDEIARQANDTSFGLAASIWTRDISAAHKLARMIKAGSIKINAPHIPDAGIPFGGYKQSGIGRENGRAGVEAFTELKSVLVGL